MSEQERKKKANRLTTQQQIALVDQLRLHREDLANRGTHYQEAAKFLSGACGFPVSEKQLYHTAKVLNLLWRPRQTRTSREAMALRYRDLRAAVVALYQDLGKPVPPALLAQPEAGH